MARPRLFGVTAMLAVFCSVPCPGSAQTLSTVSTAGKDGPAILDDGQRREKPSDETVEACWSTWLTKEGLTEGKNLRGGDFVLVGKAMETVKGSIKPAQWLAARDAAFGAAEIQVRQVMTGSVATTIQGEGELTSKYFGGDAAPDDLQKVSRTLSIADKFDVLTDAALDAEIRKFKPGWNGNGVDAAQKRSELLKALGEFRNHVAAHSELYVSGAFTPVQCEGPNQDGDYSVLVGMIWSPKLAKVAQTIWNPDSSPVPATPKATLQDQFSAFTAENPNWLAYTLGARVFTDEKGERVVVGFGAAPQTSLLSMDASRASLGALAAIQRFVGEKVEAQAEDNAGANKFELADGSVHNTDSGSFQQRVQLRSKEMKIQGATQMLSWRGINPWSGAKMQVVALAWSARWAADARQTGAALGDVERRMQHQGAMPSTVIPAEPSTAGAASGAAMPVKSGAQSSTTDF